MTPQCPTQVVLHCVDSGFTFECASCRVLLQAMRSVGQCHHESPTAQPKAASSFERPDIAVKHMPVLKVHVAALGSFGRSGYLSPTPP